MAVNILYGEINRKLSSIQNDIRQIVEDQAKGQPGVTTSVFAAYNALKQQIDSFETMAKREVTEIKREKSLSKAAKLRQEYQDLKSVLDNLRSIEESRKLTQQRDSLLQRKTPGNKTGFEDPNTLNQSQESTILMMDHFARESSTLNNAESNIDQYITMGKNALNELYEQRSMLKSTQKRLLDIANSLGLSSSVIRLIEQRTTQDKWILWGGMAVTILIMWFIYHNLR